MSSTFFNVSEPLVQATQKLWQDQIAHAGRFAAETAQLQAELAGRTRANIDESAKLVRSSFDYFVGLGETFRDASLAALKDAASFGTTKAAE